ILVDPPRQQQAHGAEQHREQRILREVVRHVVQRRVAPPEGGVRLLVVVGLLAFRRARSLLLFLLMLPRPARSLVLFLLVLPRRTRFRTRRFLVLQRLHGERRVPVLFLRGDGEGLAAAAALDLLAGVAWLVP